MKKNLLKIYNKKFNNTLSEGKNKTTLALSIWRQRRFLSLHLLLKSLYIRIKFIRTSNLEIGKNVRTL